MSKHDQGKQAYCTTRLKPTFWLNEVPLADLNVAVTVSGYMPAGVGEGSDAPPPTPQDDKVAIVESRHKQKIHPQRRRAGFVPRLPGKIIIAAKPPIPAIPINPAQRFSFERFSGCRRKPVAGGVVVAVTLACIGLDPLSVIELGFTVHVPPAGAPLHANETDCVNPWAGAKSTV